MTHPLPCLRSFFALICAVSQVANRESEAQRLRSELETQMSESQVGAWGPPPCCCEELLH